MRRDLVLESGNTPSPIDSLMNAGLGESTSDFVFLATKLSILTKKRGLDTSFLTKKDNLLRIMHEIVSCFFVLADAISYIYLTY